ncbi:hypothetical protein C8J57DRAFT_1259100 [Mycena rebaudengoi]|nr:hypothetical protein C8J57DRAFT_1259100 [Mycena rebaudengoi]
MQLPQDDNYSDTEIVALIASLDLAETPVDSPSAGSKPPGYSPLTETPRRVHTAIYVYASPIRQDVTTEWSIAGSASQGVPNTTVHRVKKKAKKSRQSGAYVVFHGHQPGVYSTWREACTLVNGVSNTIFHGYHTLAEANAAIKYAEDRGWTHRCNSQRPEPAIPALPTPMLTSDLPNPLHGSHINNKWFVVYRGITPGVYQSLLEALLNTVGVPTSLYEGIDTKQEAINKYRGAVERGEVAGVLPVYRG